jgi:hypothetical protein
MAMWFYQMSQAEWTPEEYRLDIWEGERWGWLLRDSAGNPKRISGQKRPEPGDRIVFFFAKEGCAEPGFYGWAIVLTWLDAKMEIYFRPVAPSDQLKMHPWWDPDEGNVQQIANRIRGSVAQGTLWPVAEPEGEAIGKGINAWVAGRP